MLKLFGHASLIIGFVQRSKRHILFVCVFINICYQVENGDEHEKFGLLSRECPVTPKSK